MIFEVVCEKTAADAERGRKTKDRTTPSKMHPRPVNREEKKREGEREERNRAIKINGEERANLPKL